MLQGDAEWRAEGEHDTQERVRWEAEQSATAENAQQEEEKRVAQDWAMALAQLQTEAENVPLPPETDALLDEPS
jgi:hypothetical protein